MAVCIRPGDGASSAHGQMTVSFLVCRDGTIKTWGLRELRAFGVETYEEEEEVSERDPLCDKCIGAEAELTS